MADKIISALKIKTIKGLSTLILREFAIKALAVIGQIILVRFLTPEIFGVAAIFTLVLGLADIFTDIGLTVGVIQTSSDLSVEEISTIYWIKFLLASLVCIALLLASFFWPSIFRVEMQYLWMLRLLVLTLLLRPARTLITAVLERELDYTYIPVVDVLGVVIYYVVTVSLALRGLGLWSLVGGIIAKDVGETLILWYRRPLPLHRPILTERIKCLMHFGAFLQMSSIVAVLQQYTTVLVSSLLLSPQAVGLLDTGKNIVSIPALVAENTGRVAFASFSRIQKQGVRLTRAASQTMRILGFVAVYFFVIVGVYGVPLVHLLLTDKWIPMVPILRVSLLGLFFGSGLTVLTQVLVALGKSRLTFIYQTLIVVGESVLAWVLALNMGAIGIAWAVTTGYAVQFFIYFWELQRVKLTLSLYDIYSTSIGIGLLTYMVALGLHSNLVVTSLLFFVLSGICMRQEIKQIWIIITSKDL